MTHSRILVAFALAALGFGSACTADPGEGSPASGPSSGVNPASPEAGMGQGPLAPDAASATRDGAAPTGSDAGRDGSMLDAGAAAADAGEDAPAYDANAPGNVWGPGSSCYNVVCAPGTACVESAHGQPLGTCVETCDCTNCGNCAYDNTDHRWDDQQEYCGNLKSSPATVRCNRPCSGAGSGCIYYGAVNVCWPLEGCFSAP